MSKGKLRLNKWLFKILGYIGLFLPTLILFIINRKVYFIKADGWTIGFGGVVGIAYALYLAKVGFKKFSPLAGTGIFTIVCYCFNSVSEYIFLHSVMLFIGVATYNVFLIPSNYFSKLLDTYVDEEVRVEVRNTPKKVAKTKELESGRC